ncbi:putative membrane protein [Nocardioides massiliensis]|uniref:Membrane protein n=1 Tax=Nocardioides massiliensis TaxID=1325935 RepID=A0ABT9NMA0_9ACTN|nr:glycosyltransferase 87 family protein [Nocardioides massiliensis]MDP9821339.1 putative membrane protein [Nocardioides massiliensis]
MTALPTSRVRPTHEDPALRAWSEGVGGPSGRHAAGHRWWSPVRVVLALGVVAVVLAMLQKAPCVAAGWGGGSLRYARMCYSDIGYLYTGRGYAEGVWPYAATDGRYPGMEYPVGIAVLVWLLAALTHRLAGADLEARSFLPVEDLWGAVGAGHGELALFVALNAIALGLAVLAAAYLLVRAQPTRPWDAALVVCSPVLVLTLLINWDAWALLTVAAALWAWARDRPWLAGVAVGVGVAVKLYPLFLLGAFLVVCLRRRELGRCARTLVAAVLSWLALNVPVALTGWDEWLVFWRFNSDRAGDLGSVWLALSTMGAEASTAVVNNVSWIFFAGVCLLVLLLGLVAPRTPRVAQLAFLVVLGFLLINKVYSPQYVLWLLPLAVLARPRVRDLAVWQAGEVFYFAMVWLHLGGWTAAATSGAPDAAYALAIVVRIAAQVYLGAVVVRDVLRPWHDPVRRDGLTDDPLHPVAPASAGGHGR